MKLSDLNRINRLVAERQQATDELDRLVQTRATIAQCQNLSLIIHRANAQLRALGVVIDV